MSFEIEVEEHGMVAWIPFNNTFTPEAYGSRGEWSGALFQTGTYQLAEGTGQTPGLDAVVLTTPAGGNPAMPAAWDWINILPYDLMGLDEPMEWAHLADISGKGHVFHKYFTSDDPPRTITCWQGMNGYSVSVTRSAHGSSRFVFTLKDPVRIDIYVEGDSKPAATYAPGDLSRMTLKVATATLTHHQQQEPPG
ncbi:MAG TPA: hypothetical protein VGK94_09345 [Candidatus Polarisedimenticolia bacterium]|jgi:hypothetical protein